MSHSFQSQKMTKITFRIYCLLFLSVGVVLGCHESEAPNEPETIQWETYSEDAKTTHLSSGKTVVVFVYSYASPETSSDFDNFDSSKMASLNLTNEYVPLVLSYKYWSEPEIGAIWKEVGHTKNPFIVVYEPNKAPIALNSSSLEPLKEYPYNE
ncbi:MAG: hypothetical protein COA78_11020 [Blastopirellula sp.]|nr:MAG: hypothetical protein COA78_11020 [Blastopirellula sp.]